MKSFRLYSFLTILIESFKLLPKNGKLMALTAVFSIFLSLCFSSLFVYSIQSLVNDILKKTLLTDPSSFNVTDPYSFNSADPTFTPKTGFYPAQIIGLLNHLEGYAAIFLAVEFAFFLALSIISFFSSISTILVSAYSYKAKNLTLKELLSFIYRSWTMPLVTSLYVSCLSTGYSVIIFIWASPLLMYPDISTFSVTVIVGIPALTLYLYLLVPWILSIVISVVEESCYGMEGLGKAAGLVKGKRLHGFLLNILYWLLVMIIFKGYKILHDRVSLTIVWMLVTVVLSVVHILQIVAYTVLYLQCGEEIELNGSLQYSKLPATVVLADDMP